MFWQSKSFHQNVLQGTVPCSSLPCRTQPGLVGFANQPQIFNQPISSHQSQSTNLNPPISDFLFVTFLCIFLLSFLVLTSLCRLTIHVMTMMESFHRYSPTRWSAWSCWSARWCCSPGTSTRSPSPCSPSPTSSIPFSTCSQWYQFFQPPCRSPPPSPTTIPIDHSQGAEQLLLAPTPYIIGLPSSFLRKRPNTWECITILTISIVVQCVHNIYISQGTWWCLDCRPWLCTGDFFNPVIHDKTQVGGWAAPGDPLPF